MVVWNCSDYIEEANRQLNDTPVYKPLHKDPGWEIAHKIQDVVQKAQTEGLIDTDLADVLIIQHPKTPLLYLLQKIHKSLQKPPGRPIVTGKGSILNNIFIFLGQSPKDIRY